MSSFLLGVTIFIAVLTAAGLYRVAMGKTIFDRIIAATLVGTNGLILLTLIGFLFERISMFIDIAIAYALLNFVIVIALGKYFDLVKEKP
ncbi:MAG: pH regulation protein F [Dehalococcoidales bacterium]|jgi:multicomponent Na+:H+ antiporter subunit F|nr:pH regulation protein F [Dehalococcoidales bacterium]MDP6576824.1 monovalent cation/H+ antiporter complex subunit F [Dehalococcoidales bacterium]MDP6825480.1 monovalent cation/H+ antiporter complex subunit F [Dehalococcoidales bacterium]|tara:strand:- start:678 stop:947 length:270 start_codon:yes stop_codon:yes gene_type:complete